MRSQPWSWYGDAAVERLERERIFRPSWQYVGRAEQVSSPGSYVAADAAGVPVVVTRARDDELRAFVNVCRHRGSIVVDEGEGKRETLQCPYHGWTYGLDGRLRSAPRAEELPAEELGLVPAAVDAWGPFLFVSADAEPLPLEDVLGPLPGLLEEAGVRVDELRFRLRAEFELAANWKVACENYLECYHCPVAHPAFSAHVDVRPEAYRLADNGAVASQLGPVRADGRGPDATGEVGAGSFHFAWPNLKVNVYPGRPNLSIGPVVPAGTDRCRGFLDYFFAPDADEAWVEELLAFDDQVGREDRVLVERVQRGVGSGVLTDGPLLRESEQLIVWFQQRVAAALGESAPV